MTIYHNSSNEDQQFQNVNCIWTVDDEQNLINLSRWYLRFNENDVIGTNDWWDQTDKTIIFVIS